MMLPLQNLFDTINLTKDDLHWLYVVDHLNGGWC